MKEGEPYSPLFMPILKGRDVFDVHASCIKLRYLNLRDFIDILVFQISDLNLSDVIDISISVISSHGKD